MCTLQDNIKLNNKAVSFITHSKHLTYNYLLGLVFCFGIWKPSGPLLVNLMHEKAIIEILSKNNNKWKYINNLIRNYIIRDLNNKCCFNFLNSKINKIININYKINNVTHLMHNNFNNIKSFNNLINWDTLNYKDIVW
jgi:hypothetical protein